MKICKYCKKPILGDDVWNPDSEGNGYHQACLNEMQFRLRDRQIYDKGRADVLDKIRAEIMQNSYPIVHGVNNHEFGMTLYGILQVLDKYKYNAESEVEDV